MKRIKNVGISIAVSLICVCIVCGSVLAKEGEYNRGSHVASRGAVNYANGKVVIDSADLTYLANEIDDLERSYKSLTVEALNGIGTYYASADGEIIHEPDDSNITPDDAEVLSFDDLYQGILQSQSVEYLADTQATDESENHLYYADENAAESGDLITVTSDANDFPLMIRPADAGNLTAGTAAWVNGEVLVGNGADNRAYYDKGKKDAIPVDSVTTTTSVRGIRYSFSNVEYCIAGAKSVSVRIATSGPCNDQDRMPTATINNRAISMPRGGQSTEKTWNEDEIGGATVLYLRGAGSPTSDSDMVTVFTVTTYYR